MIRKIGWRAIGIGVALIAGIPIARAWYIPPDRCPDIQWRENSDTQRLRIELQRRKTEYEASVVVYQHAKAQYGKKSAEAVAARRLMKLAENLYQEMDYEYGWMIWAAH